MLFLKTFGGLSVEIDGAPGTGAGQQRKTLALLALLAAAGRRGVSRDKLTVYLWPESDTEHARNLLKQACFALRRDLHAPELILGAVELRLNSNVITSDIGALEDALAGGDSARAVSIYTGPFLDGFYLAGAAEFERWVEETRSALKARVADALEGLAQHAATNGDSIGAVKLWRQLVSLDPLAARAVLGLLRALIAAGERSAALEFGRVHENLVRRELDVAPDPSVSQLLDSLRERRELGEATASIAVQATDVTTPPATPTPRRLGRRLALAGAVLIVLASLVVAVSRLPRDRLDPLADSVSLDVMRRLTPPTSWAFPRLMTPGTSSLPALKAFMRGEAYLRRFSLDSAIASYALAIALDSTFAVALRRMAVAKSWDFQAGDEDAARARRFIGTSGPRDSLMIAYSARAAAFSSPEFYRIVFAQDATLHEMFRRYRDDPELWHEIGELQFHVGFVWPEGRWNRARDSFNGAIARDSGYAPAYVHPVEISLSDNDPGAALRYVRAYLAIPSVNREGAGMRLLGMLLDGEHRSHSFDRELDVASLVTLRRLAYAIRLWPDADETQIAVTRRLLESARLTVPSEPVDTEYGLRSYRSMLAQALIHRGRLREARRIVENRLVMPEFMTLAELGVIPRDSVESALDSWIDNPEQPGVHLLFPWLMEGRCYRTMDAALWWAGRRDIGKLQRLLRREESATRTFDVLRSPPHARPVREFVRAALELARGDTTVALERILPDSTCPGAPQRRAMQFRLLAASGRDTEAAWVWDRIYDRRVPLMLERARVAERSGDPSTAIHYYQFVAQAWLHADRELQPVVAEARVALRRLGDVQ
jgi:DNA-binding SARP family transcriptional activator